MERRTFKDGSQVSLLGYGTMRFPLRGSRAADIDEAEAARQIDYAYENGVNYFDTAWMYHDYTSEAFVGKVLSRYPRNSFNLATKMPPWELESERDLARIFDEQLRRCKVDYFDYYLLHCVSRSTLPMFENVGAYEFCREQQKKGKLRHLGFSIHDSAELLTYMLDKWEFDFVQIQLNYLDWDQLDSRGLYETARGRDIPIIVMEPIRGGTLATLCPESVAILQAAAPERSIASWAMRYAALPGVLCVLSGMSSMEQVKDNIATYQKAVPLTPGEREALARAVETYRAKATVPCTACRYCIPCPVGVDIPQSFGAYNLYKGSGNKRGFCMEYEFIGEGNQPDSCTQCGACLERCPQQLDIPKLLDEIAKTYVGLAGYS